MNKYFLKQQMNQLEEQMKGANLNIHAITDEQFELINLSLKLATLEKLEEISGNLIDIESKLDSIERFLRGPQCVR